MNFNIIELGGTLVVGAYLILGFLLISHIFFETQILERIQKFTQFEDIGLRALLVTIFFATGMLAEDLSNKFVDIDTPLQEINVLPSEQNLRYEALFGSTDSTKLNKLGETIVLSGLLSMHDRANGEKIRKSVENAIPFEHYQIDKDDLKSSSSSLYYQAKNITYKEKNYYDELSKIQTRIDFSRSFATISLFLGFVTIVTFFVKVGKMSLYDKGNGIASSDPKVVVYKAGMLLISFAVLFGIGRMAYASEEREFNNRVFGYYYSSWQERHAGTTSSITSYQNQSSPSSEDLPAIQNTAEHAIEQPGKSVTGN